MLTNMTPEAFITQLSVQLGVRYTAEQVEMIKNMDKSMFVYADPGTGKTSTVTAGLVFAELYKQIPGDKICAVSFTNDATAELANRHKHVCRKLKINENVNFKTLHKICTAILKENYKLLGMAQLKICSDYNYDTLQRVMTSSARELGVCIQDNQVRNISKALQSANSSLTFSKSALESRMYFKEAHVSYEDFMIVRKLMYEYNSLSETIQVSDIMLYTLQLLTQHPEVAEEFKKNCQLLVVDESQDMSLLQLRLISLLADNVVFVGDMKQQIYGFNGACQEVGHYFKVFYPEAKILSLTQSFRCDNAIADYAKPIVLPNGVGGEDFKGTGPGGTVECIPDLDINKIVSRISKDMQEHKGQIVTQIMILYRNNYTSVPVIDALYRAGIPVRCTKHVEAFKMPVIGEMLELVEIARTPSDTNKMPALRYIIPEFVRYGKAGVNPIMKIALQTGMSLFDITYKFQDEYTGSVAMELLLDVREMLLQGEPLSDILNKIWPTYNNLWLRNREWMLDFPATYYTKLVNPLIEGRTYDQFLNAEIDKSKKIMEANKNLVGVRCSTFHSAKGLEADVVYLMDVDANTVPNVKQIEKMVKAGCLIDVARNVNNERSLLFVACTRARHELYISYDSSVGPSTLITEPETYANYDLLYANNRQTYDDVEIFNKFVCTSCKDMRGVLDDINKVVAAAELASHAADIE